MASYHRPVMLEEAVAALEPGTARVVVDATFGGGGHTMEVLRQLGPRGRLIAIDRDPAASERAALVRDPRFSFVPGAYDEVLWGMVEESAHADAVLFDLGLSSYQIDEPGRGFSYVREGPLDMRMDTTAGITAADFLNTADTVGIIQVLHEHGDVPRSQARRVAREILRRRPLSTTTDLVDAVRDALGWVERGGNPAKRVFQAVRVHVNDEPGKLQRALEAAERVLSPGGRLVVITFHSGEDRLVKKFIAERTGRCACPPELPVCVCGARPVFRKGKVGRPSEAEVESNPRSASARLRVAYRTTEPPMVSEGGA